MNRLSAILLAAGLLGFGLPFNQAAAQLRVLDRAGLTADRAVPPAIELSLIDAGQPARPAVLAAPWGQLAGQTAYDLQTNRATGHRVTATGARVATVWTQVCPTAGGPNSSQRGVGYNRADVAGGALADSGTHCAGPYGIAGRRTGWPELVRVGGQDVVFAHLGDSGVVRISRPSDTAPWMTSAPLPFTYNIGGQAGRTARWPRAVASGTTVHLIYIANVFGNPLPPHAPSGLNNPLLYCRSLDGGLTWDRQNILLPDFDRAHLRDIGADNYALAVHGNTVAVTAGSFGDPTLLAVSYDGGSTFTTSPLTQPFTDADTVRVVLPGPGVVLVGAIVPDGAQSLVVDTTDAVHWFSGAQLIEVVPDSLVTGRWAPTHSYFPDYVAQLLYWNSRELAASPPQVIADYSAAGIPLPSNASTQAYGPAYSVIGSISMPTAAVSPSGEVYCVFAQRMPSLTPGAPGLFRDLYLQKLTFPGVHQVQAYVPRNISRELRGLPNGAAALHIESAYPSACPTIENGLLNYQWLSDTIPGAGHYQPGAPTMVSSVMLDTIRVGQTVFQPWRLLTGNIPAGLAAAATMFELSFRPNPTAGPLTLQLDTHQPLTATLAVRDVLGRLVLAPAPFALPAGSHALPFDLTGQPAGVYVVTVTTGGYRTTRRLLKQ